MSRGRSPRRAVALAGAAVAIAACRPAASPAARAVPAPATREDHCWWAVLSSAQPPDTVARRFASAFAAAGLEGAAWAHDADTAWATSRVTTLARGASGARYASRVVAYRRGDSTHYRHFVTVAPPARGWTRAADTADGASGRRLIGFCAELARASGVRGLAPRQPTGEEGLPVWRRGR